MKIEARLRYAAVGALLLAGCGAPAEMAPAESAKAATPSPIAAAPTPEALLALDRQAQEAFFRGDAAHFEGMLSDRFVMLAPDGARMDKSATTAMFSGVRCEVKDGWTLDEPRLSSVDADTWVLTYRGTFDGSCTAGGETARAPSPVRGATVWTRSGEQWLAAFHGENPIFDPAAPAPPKAEPPAPTSAAAADATTASHAGPNIAALVAIETAVWEGWAARDEKALDERMAKDVAFVDIFGNVTNGRAETLRFWTEHACDVRSVRVTDGTASAVSPTVEILTFQGHLEGTCGGQPFPVIHGTSVYTKEGDAWKLAFTLNHLTN